MSNQKKTVLVLEREDFYTSIFFNCPTLKKAKESGLNVKNISWEKVTEEEGRRLVEELETNGQAFGKLRL